MASATEWLDLKEELVRANTGRYLDYYQLWNAYQGNLWNLTGAPPRTDSAGRTILRNTGRDGQKNKALVVNHLKGIVDDYVALLSALPDVKVPAPGPSDDEQAFADRCERFHYGVWHASYMAMQMKAVAWWDSVMGSTCGIVWPDFKRKHPLFRFVAPYMKYTIPDDEEPFAVSKAIICERFPARSVRETYPGVQVRSTFLSTSAGNTYISTASVSSSGSADGSIEVVKCFDKNEVVTIVDGQERARATHSMGFCPVVEIPNILVPGTIGMSDIEQVVGLAQHASFIAQAYEEYVLQDIYSPIIVEGLMEGKVPEDINTLNPNEVIPVNIGGKVYRLPAGQGSTVVGQELARTQQLMEYNTGVPQIRTEGQTRSGWTTGRGVDRMQGPYFSRTQYRTDILSVSLERMNTMAVQMQTALFPKAKFTMFGTKGRAGSPYAMNMTTKELEDYSFNKVLYSMGMGMDPMQRMVWVLQGIKGGLMTKRFAIEFLGYTDHPDEELKGIEIDQEKDLQKQIRLRASAQGGGGNPAEEAANLEGGGTAPASLVAAGEGSAPPPSLTVPIGRPSPPGAGAPTSASAPPFALNPNAPPEREPVTHDLGLGTPLLQQVTRIVEGLALKGKVWVSQQGDRVRVTAEKLADSKRIHNALDPLYGKKVSVRTAKNPPPNANEITASAGTPATTATGV